MAILKTKVKPIGVQILLWVVVALITINLLDRFGIMDFTAIQPDVLTLFAIFFVSAELGIMSAIQGKKKLDGISMFGSLVVIISLIALILGWFGMNIGFLNPFKGFIELALLTFVVIEIFR